MDAPETVALNAEIARLTERVKALEAGSARAEKLARLGHWDWDIAGDSLFWSGGVYEIFGVDRSFELSFENIARRIHPDDRETNEKFVRNLFNTGGRGFQEFRIFRPDGSIRTVEQFAEIDLDSPGRPARAFGTMRDVSDRAVMEKALRESQQFYMTLVDQPFVGVSVIQDGKVIYGNRVLASVLGVGFESLAGLPLSEISGKLHPDDAIRVKEIYEGRAAGMPAPEKYAMRLSDGKGGHRWIEVFARSLEHRGRRATQLIMSDETARRSSEEELTRLKEVLETVLMHTSVLVAYLDPDFRFIWVNRAFADAQGGSSFDYAGRSFFEFHPDPGMEEESRHVITSGRTYHSEGIPFPGERDQKREPGFWDLSIVPVRKPGSRIAGAVLTLRDVSERRKLERDFLEIHDSLQIRTGRDLHDGVGQELVSAAYIAKALERRLSDFGLVEAADARRLVEAVNATAARVRAISRGLNPLLIGDGGLPAALEEMCSQVRDTFEIAASFECGGDLSRFREEAARHVLFVAREAVTNAVKHSGCSRLRITLKRNAGSIRLRVSDDGRGIRLPIPENAGMGLMIMKYRASMLRGTLAVGRECGGGTAVQLVFPEREAVAEEG